jgi:hypothetical protein
MNHVNYITHIQEFTKKWSTERCFTNSLTSPELNEHINLSSLLPFNSDIYHQRKAIFINLFIFIKKGQWN